MDLIADILLVAGALGAGFYCIILARRLNRFTDLEKGVGGAIAVLSAQVDDMTKTLTRAQHTAAGSAVELTELTARAESVAKRMELLIASMHDLPEPEPARAPAPQPFTAERSVTAERSAPEEFAEEALFLSHRNRMGAK
ncbi:hypothetical protein [Candidatus Halocynthiibacter alkanivorans]|uniref:hypothetical protein n=1 Tax=Candidatus Halocynthiibacter alkanivorans TaxID=2267619 RepID=UPI000DF16BCD|nr:hypothetical protein [Candidatus Halocynthiibacter alkanivorans]